jgi:phosphoglycerate dehydrogenase-like enzyme
MSARSAASSNAGSVVSLADAADVGVCTVFKRGRFRLGEREADTVVQRCLCVAKDTGVRVGGVTLVWLPYADAAQRIGGLPAGLTADVWEGSGPWPDSVAEVELYVLPYMLGESVLAPLSQMSRLRVVQTLTAGYEGVLPYLSHLEQPVVLCNAAGVHDASTAELAVALMLASLRGLDDFARAAADGSWLQGTRPALADSRVLIIGYGSVGAAVERRLAGFEVEVVRVARTPRAVPAGPVHGYHELADLLAGADVVVLCVPLTDETRALVDARFLAQMRDGALLVNVSRGPVVDTSALLAELTSGRLRAALDVTDPEPLPPGHPLWSAPGVLISPHVGGNTSAFLPRAFALLADQLERFATGRPLRNVVSRRLPS